MLLSFLFIIARTFPIVTKNERNNQKKNILKISFIHSILFSEYSAGTARQERSGGTYGRRTKECI
jgi:hypothetical protein